MISIEEIRKSMRISHKASDDEINRDMETARLDMKRAGIHDKKDDALIDKAIELYCKAQFDYLGKGEQFQKAYERLVDSMALSGDYRCEMN